MSLADTAAEALHHVTAALPAGGESRQGQVDMLNAVAEAIENERHLIAQAGTGTGKSLAYLIPVILSGKKTVIATATKALQDQIATTELPHLRSQLEKPFSWAVLKGRNNYVCRQRVNEFSNDAQLSLAGTSAHNEDEVEKLVEFSDTSSTGDRAELDFEPSPASWSAVSVTSKECPGRNKCPSGDNCFAEMARDRANAADVIVVNTHLLATDMRAEQGILPEHDIVVIDEAHQLDDIATSSFGSSINGARMRWFAGTADRILVDPEMIDKLRDVGDDLSDALEPYVGERLPPGGVEDIAIALDRARDRVNTTVEKLRGVPKGKDSDADARRLRAEQAGLSLLGELIEASALDASNVAWVERSGNETTLQVAPLDVASMLGPVLVENRTAILTSATLPQATAAAVGLEEDEHDRIDVDSPFDYPNNALLYCAKHLPEPRSPEYERAMLTHLVELMSSAGGRTLGLFTSYRMMDAAAEFLETYIKTPILTQRDYPKPVLIEKFKEDPATSLLATLGFWQGIDIPGPSLSLVTIDRLPFPRPDDPLLSARRDLAGRHAFKLIDLPRASTLLAQGAGRLIRSKSDQGVVAVLDSRLSTKKSYRWDLINALPDFTRTSDPEVAMERLRTIAAVGASGTDASALDDA
ncbi:ATP-dependent DNA helicase [Acidimicrobiales bacterium]|nr:ATP-dependent DNA helicase [Acidimicrobiales bacterium]